MKKISPLSSLSIKIHLGRIIFVLIFFSLFFLTSVSALDITLHVPEKYTDVQAGERFYFEIEIKYPENPSRKDFLGVWRGFS